MFCLGMTEQEWNDAVEHFGLSPEEAADYRDAFADVERLGWDGFIDLVFDETRAAVRAQRAGFPPTAAAVRRAVARKTVVVEFAGGEATVLAQLQQLTLAGYDGPTH
jgi:hypothetical protein